MKTAKPSPRSGVALPAGAHPGNTGGKPGRSGRRPDEFKALMRDVVNRPKVLAAFRRILANPDHADFLRAFRMAAEIGYGRSKLLEVLHIDGGTIDLEDLTNEQLEHLARGGSWASLPRTIHVQHTIVDPQAPEDDEERRALQIREQARARGADG